MVCPFKDNHQAATNYLKLYIKSAIDSEFYTTAMQLKSSA